MTTDAERDARYHRETLAVLEAINNKLGVLLLIELAIAAAVVVGVVAAILLLAS